MVDDRRKDAPLSERLAILEIQMARLVSDAESEKDTRKRANASLSEKFELFDQRMRRVERSVWTAAGAITVIVLVINIWAKHL